MANLNVPSGSLAQRLVNDLPYSRPPTPAHQGPIQVGWIGLGAMGYLMARNLANHRASHPEHQPPLLVWNRSKEKSEKLLHELGEAKVAIAQTAVDVAIKCDIIISSLSGDAIVKSVFKENVAALQARNSYIYLSARSSKLGYYHRHNPRRNPKYL
jgi:ornithine cyclodeaminase/alanine dehydrogenase-like protein (mu-crystallin family)